MPSYPVDVRVYPFGAVSFPWAVRFSMLFEGHPSSAPRIRKEVRVTPFYLQAPKAHLILVAHPVSMMPQMAHAALVNLETDPTFLLCDPTALSGFRAGPTGVRRIEVHFTKPRIHQWIQAFPTQLRAPMVNVFARNMLTQARPSAMFDLPDFQMSAVYYRLF